MPALHHPRDVHRQRPRHRHLGQALSREHVQGGARARAAARIEAVYAVGRRVVHQREEIAPNPRHRRFDDGEHGGCRDRGVHGVAAALQGAEARGGGQGLAARDHAVPAKRGRTGLAGVARGSIPGRCQRDVGRHHDGGRL
ncbi:MAG: hypothetical protein R2712_17430 [Vicinamibacterales bacterium]